VELAGTRRRSQTRFIQDWGDAHAKKARWTPGFARRDSERIVRAVLVAERREFFRATTALIGGADRRMGEEPRTTACGVGGSTISQQTGEELFSHAVGTPLGASGTEIVLTTALERRIPSCDPGDLHSTTRNWEMASTARAGALAYYARASADLSRRTGDRTRRLLSGPKENTRHAHGSSTIALRRSGTGFTGGRTGARTNAARAATEAPVAEPNPLDQEDEE